MKPKWIDSPAHCLAAFLWLAYFWFTLQDTLIGVHWALPLSWGILAVTASVYAGSTRRKP